MAEDHSTIGEQDASRFVTDTPPTHYDVRLEGFSLLAKNNVERYDTAEFEVGKYKWKLIIYPNGIKSRNVNNNISVYITVAEGSFTDLCPGIHAVFKVSILDQKMDNYYSLQVANGRHFNKMMLEWGFDHFMPLKTFNDPSNGYLVDDSCVFRAEVYIKEHDICKAERLAMVKNTNSYTHTWKIDSFSSIATRDMHESISFNSRDQKWKIRLSPKGYGAGKGSHISIFLALADPARLPVASRIYAEFTLRIIDQVNAKHYFNKTKNWFGKTSTSYGWNKFISLIDFNEASKGYLVKDKCIIEAEVTVLGVTTAV